MNQEIRHIVNLDWITILIVGCLLCLAIIKYIYPRKFDDFLLIVSSDKFLSGSIKNNSLFHPFNSSLLAIQWIAIPLFIYIGYCIYTDLDIGQYSYNYLYILIGYIVFEQGKLILEHMIGYLINFREVIKPHIYRKITFKNLLSLVVLFFCILLVYNGDTLHKYYTVFVGITLLIYFFSLLFLIRKFQNLILRQPSYFILYFCTLEIAPYYIIYKVFI